MAYSIKVRHSVFENRALRKIFGPKREEEIGDWIKIGTHMKLRNGKLHDFESSNIFLMINARKER